MDLDNPKKIKALDPGRVGDSIELLPDQMRQVLADARLIKIPREFSRITHVVVNGMGGSNLGARLAQAVWSNEMKVPLLIEPGYDVPAYVGKNTLYLISSYSGTTEEPLSTYREARKRGAKIIALTEDSPKSRLKKMILKDDIPGYIFKPEFNPSGQPRMGIGYTAFGMLVLMARAGIFKIAVREMEEIIAKMEIWTRKLKPEEPVKLNQVKQLALKLKNKNAVLVSAGHLAGNVHIARNQLSESSKYFSSYLTLPELNHYSMEGLANPPANKKNLIFVFFDSKLYHPKIQRRALLTKQVIKKNGIEVLSHELKGKTRKEQGFEMLQFGEWLSYYLGMIYEVDPQKIPWVDWFKKQLK